MPTLNRPRAAAAPVTTHADALIAVLSAREAPLPPFRHAGRTVDAHGLRRAGDGLGPPEPFVRAQVLTAVRYLRCLRPTITARPRSPGSYGLKHDAERWGERHGMAPYVTDGALIAAAIALGVPVEPHSPTSSSAAIGVRHDDRRRVDSLRFPPPRPSAPQSQPSLWS